MILKAVIILLIGAWETIYCRSQTVTVGDDSKQVYYLEPGCNLTFAKNNEIYSSMFSSTDFRIFCYLGSEKIITNYFQTIYLQLDIDNDDFVQYDGDSPDTVKEHYDENKSLFSFSFFSYKKTRLKLNPFNQTCTGIETKQPYKIQLNLIRIDVTKIFLLTIGIVIFFYASKLSTNSIFYYASGIGIGISASLLILIYLSGKLFPSKPMMYGILIGGWTIAYYMFNLIFDNIQLILVTYHTYVLWYIMITGFISFVICYRLGPPKNKRSKDLIKWSLQLAAIIAIYFSSQLNEATYVIIIGIMVAYYCPRMLLGKLKKSYRILFPPKKRLLTIEEFEAEGIVETKKALRKLREYCSSPECKSWKIMSKLKDPKRFASFIEGENHVWEEEVFDHENSRDDISDDSENSNVANGICDGSNVDENEEISEDDADFKNIKPRRHLSRKEIPLINSSNSPRYRHGFEHFNTERDPITRNKRNNGENSPYQIGWNNIANLSPPTKNEKPHLSMNYQYEYSDDE